MLIAYFPPNAGKYRGSTFQAADTAVIEIPLPHNPKWHLMLMDRSQTERQGLKFHRIQRSENKQYYTQYPSQTATQYK
jgi:hypothetical protein